MGLGLLDQLQIPMTVVSDRIAGALNRSGATQVVALNIYKAFDRVWHAFPLHKLKSYGLREFQIRFLALFCLFSVIDSFGWFWMGILNKNIQLMVEFLQALFLFLWFDLWGRLMGVTVEAKFPKTA